METMNYRSRPRLAYEDWLLSGYKPFAGSADVTGPRGTGNVPAGQRRVDMEEKILLLEPDSTPLTVLSAKADSKPTVNPKFDWFEDALAPRFDSINMGGGATSGATSLTVANGANFAQHDLVKVTRTGEVFRVTAVATNTLTVVRGIGGGAAAINNADELLIGSSAQPEGDTSKPARSNNATQRTNYTQILRFSFESTGTLIHSDSFTNPSDWTYQANKAGIEHAKNLEYAYWHGRSSEDTSGAQPRRTTAGALSYIITNQTVMAGNMTDATLFGALRPAFRYGMKTKTAFCSMLAVDVLNAFPRGKVQVIQGGQGNDTYGLQVMRFVSPHGVLNLVTNYLFEGAVYGGYIAILDLSVVKKRYLANSEGSRDTHILNDIQAPDADTRKSEYLSEVGLEFGNDKQHALVTNITG